MWEPLLRESPPDAPWVGPIRAQMAEVAGAAGIRYTLPDAPQIGALARPDADAVAAAEAMTPEEQKAMIEGMVGQLAERLATEGGPAAEWARLITALEVLGEMDRAMAIYTEAQQRFAPGSPDGALIEAAAIDAGLTR